MEPQDIEARMQAIRVAMTALQDELRWLQAEARAALPPTLEQKMMRWLRGKIRRPPLNEKDPPSGQQGESMIERTTPTADVQIEERYGRPPSKHQVKDLGSDAG
jgi:hypothetical protein